MLLLDWRCTQAVRRFILSNGSASTQQRTLCIEHSMLMLVSRCAQILQLYVHIPGVHAACCCHRAGRCLQVPGRHQTCSSWGSCIPASHQSAWMLPRECCLLLLLQLSSPWKRSLQRTWAARHVQQWDLGCSACAAMGPGLLGMCSNGTWAARHVQQWDLGCSACAAMGRVLQLQCR
jgi:hypothetical protein